MTRRPIRLPRDGEPMLDIFSLGRTGLWRPFTPQQIQQISRTVRHMPEVMVKVTGGGTKVGAVAAHMSYISRHGKLAIETDDGTRAVGKDEQKALLTDWHLELSAGQYRGSRDGQRKPRRTKLVHNVVLSMPSPTPPDKVRAAARNFAREKFGTQHRYAMVLHTDQQHPHVHIVVKAESELGRRLHIDKEMLRQWREDFARMMREQGIAANATPRVARGHNKGKTRDARYRAQRRGASTVLRADVMTIAKQLQQTGAFRDPMRTRLIETRKELVGHWIRIAETLDAQGEIELAGDVRYFAHNLPSMLTHKERLATQFTEHRRSNREGAAPHTQQSYDRTR
jgi:hypothetical protein